MTINTLSPELLHKIDAYPYFGLLLSPIIAVAAIIRDQRCRIHFGIT